MLEVAKGEPPARGYQPRPWGPQGDGMGPPQSLAQLSTADIHGHRASASETQEIIEELRRADELWQRSQEASENAPPDPAFPHRVRALAAACEQQGAALARAGWREGFAWTPLPDRRYMTLSHELRPGGNRPGPLGCGPSSIAPSSGWASRWRET